MTSPSTQRKDNVIREFPPVGARYRIRVLEDEKARKRVVDIREYVLGDSWEGYTRRGIRLTDRAQVDLLRDALREILESMLI